MAYEGIVDSHIHLYPQSEVATLAWCNDKHPLNGQYSVDEYLSALGHAPRLRGFIFIETDRKSHLDSDEGWEQPLRELDWISRVVAGTPRPGEGHTPEHAQYCLGIILWAPIPLGPDALCRYVEKVKAKAGSCNHLIKGFRYLVQDKPKGTMTQPNFIESLRWLGEHDYTFDLGVDQRSGGDWQLEEAVEMIWKAHKGLPEEKKVTVIISRRSSSFRFKYQVVDVHLDHMCKPDMRLPGQYEKPMNSPILNPSFGTWTRQIHYLAQLSKTYMKISGGFSEIYPFSPLQEELNFRTRADLMRVTYGWIQQWLDKVLSEFGPSRIMFGSDWPVCNMGGGGSRVAWMNVRLILGTNAVNSQSKAGCFFERRSLTSSS